MINVLCVKHGTLYGPEYVNRLHNMIKRHLTLPHKFICFTENTLGIDPLIEIRILPHDIKLSGWWWKPYLFKEDHFNKDDINLFFDLDMVIIGNINNLLTYMPGKFLGLEDLSRVYRKYPQKLGSAVLRWPAGQYSDIWYKIQESPNIVNSFRGDQDWIWSLYKDQITFYPESWIQSYKWEIRSQSELIRQGSKQIFKEIKNPTVHSDTVVLAFHGTPNPEDVLDPIIINNWW